MNRRTFLVSGSAAGSALALGLGRPRRAFAAKTLRLFTPAARLLPIFDTFFSSV